MAAEESGSEDETNDEAEAGLKRAAKRGEPQADVCAAGATEQCVSPQGSTGEDKRSRPAAHRARCRICRHPQREEIEREFVDWTSPREMAKTWGFTSYRAIYRHAHAMGLFERRRRNLRGALERIIERVTEVNVTASAVVAAIRLDSQMERESCKDVRRPTPKPGFVLSMDGLPRTNAVTGYAPGESTRGDAVLPVEEELMPTEAGDEAGGSSFAKATEDRSSFARVTEDNPETGKNSGDGASLIERDQTSTDPPSPGVGPTGEDPRVTLGKDKWVAGMPWPWPKGKIEFARVGKRWRGRRGRPGS